jgi:hypothetical protein
MLRRDAETFGLATMEVDVELGDRGRFEREKLADDGGNLLFVSISCICHVEATLVLVLVWGGNVPC